MINGSLVDAPLHRIESGPCSRMSLPKPPARHRIIGGNLSFVDVHPIFLPWRQFASEHIGPAKNWTNKQAGIRAGIWGDALGAISHIYIKLCQGAWGNLPLSLVPPYIPSWSP